MAGQLTPKRVYEMLRHYEQGRPDIGARKAILDALLEPASPFDCKGGRIPKRWFVLVALLLAIAVGCFAYFNGLA